MTIQEQADVILTNALTVVCDGWTEPRHARVVLTAGDPEQISHGMCDDCSRQLAKRIHDTAGIAKATAISIADTERFERMREAHRELYDALRELLAAGQFAVDSIDDVAVLLRLGQATDHARGLLAKIDGDTK